MTNDMGDTKCYRIRFLLSTTGQNHDFEIPIDGTVSQARDIVYQEWPWADMPKEAGSEEKETQDENPKEIEKQKSSNGLPGSEKPESLAQIRILYRGRFLEDDVVFSSIGLTAYAIRKGDSYSNERNAKSEEISTVMHIVPRPANSGRSNGASGKLVSALSGCCCIIC